MASFWSQLLKKRAQPQPAQELEAFGLEVRASDGGFTVTGDTYRHHRALRQAGGRWYPERKAWRFDDAEGLAAACALISAPAASGLAEPHAAYRTPQAADPKTTADWGTKHYHGHRARLRQRFLDAGAEALADYELLELLLFFAVRMRDTKPLAKELIARFGGLGDVLAAEPSRLAEIGGFKDDDERHFASVLFKLVRDIDVRARLAGLREAPLIGSPEELSDYLASALAHVGVEEFHALFLDTQNRLIRDERLGRGTVDHTPLYPREIAKRALELGAVAVILVHNHPSGDPTPSPEDLASTQRVVEALAAVDVAVYDHVVVGRAGQTSFRARGLL
ncbi:MAG: RadC family protein [Alphaproteobacteria bacterium]